MEEKPMAFAPGTFEVGNATVSVPEPIYAADIQPAATIFVMRIHANRQPCGDEPPRRKKECAPTLEK